MTIRPADRVIRIPTGEVGHIEEIDGDWAGVSILTPDNVPSCCVSWGRIKDLRKVPPKVLPMPRSKEWKAESKAFCDFIASVIESEGI